MMQDKEVMIRITSVAYHDFDTVEIVMNNGNLLGISLSIAPGLMRLSLSLKAYEVTLTNIMALFWLAYFRIISPELDYFVVVILM